MPCVPVTYAVLDAMRTRSNTRWAVVDLDMAAAAGVTTVADVASMLSSRRSWRGVRGIRRAREAVALATDYSLSPPETLLRLVWLLDAGLPLPRLNQPLLDRSGRVLGYPDLLDVEAGLVIEYDGELHREDSRRTQDQDRDVLFRDHGLEVTRVVKGELKDRSSLAHRLRELRTRAPFEPEPSRRWTVLKELVPPLSRPDSW
jgi:hypothetical protein